MLALDSLEVRLKKLAEERNLFVWVGFTATTAVAVVGGTGLAFFGAPAAWTLMDTLSGSCAAITVRVSSKLGSSTVCYVKNQDGTGLSGRENK